MLPRRLGHRSLPAGSTKSSSLDKHIPHAYLDLLIDCGVTHWLVIWPNTMVVLKMIVHRLGRFNTPLKCLILHNFYVDPAGRGSLSCGVLIAYLLLMCVVGFVLRHKEDKYSHRFPSGICFRFVGVIVGLLHKTEGWYANCHQYV